MNIVLAGGTGQIGSQLTKLLVDEGHNLVILTRRPETKAPVMGITYAFWDGKTLGGWKSYIDGADVVFNLAGENIGEKPWTPARLESIRASRVDAGKILVEAVKQAAKKPALFVQASAVGYYGTVRNTPLDENTPPGEDLMADICLDWENSTKAVEEFGVRRIILRTGLVLEKERGILPRMMLPIRLFAGGPIGSGRQVLSWIHIEDELAAIKYLIGLPQASGAYNLTAPNPVTNRDFGKELAKVLKRPFWMPVPAFALKILLGSQSELVLEGQNVIPKRLLDSGYQFNHPELSETLENLLS